VKSARRRALAGVGVGLRLDAARRIDDARRLPERAPGEVVAESAGRVVLGVDHALLNLLLPRGELLVAQIQTGRRRTAAAAAGRDGIAVVSGDHQRRRGLGKVALASTLSRDRQRRERRDDRRHAK
jgi:hypothetical protein